MKTITTLFTAVLVLILTSCNNQPKPAAEETTAADTTALAVPVFTPYKAVLVQGTVKDYDKWFASFSANDSLRRANGLVLLEIGRGLENDKDLVTFSESSDIQKAKDFYTDPAMKERRKKAGVVGTPVATYHDVIRDDTTTIPQRERLMVMVKVKDFDAWLKVYDGEGLATRAAHGLIDRGMTRGVDDPNTVTLFFAITDMEKAKARMASPELKQLMADSGVEGAPQFTWFKWVN